MSRETRRRWAFNERFLIGADNPAGPMLHRWRLIQTPWFGIYVHFIYREDLDRDPHDHPWTFFSFVLCGGYVEQHWDDARLGGTGEGYLFRSWGKRRSMLRAGRSHYFPLSAAHRITQVHGKTITLVLVGRKQRDWGFWTDTGWVNYRDYLKLDDQLKVAQ